jgi:hypothetical protein
MDATVTSTQGNEDEQAARTAGKVSAIERHGWGYV